MDLGEPFKRRGVPLLEVTTLSDDGHLAARQARDAYLRGDVEASKWVIQNIYINTYLHKSDYTYIDIHIISTYINYLDIDIYLLIYRYLLILTSSVE